MNYKVYLLSPLVGDGNKGNAFRPRLADDYSEIGWSDVTGREVPDLPGVPDAIMVVCECTLEQVTLLESGSNYYVVATEEIENETIEG